MVWKQSLPLALQQSLPLALQHFYQGEPKSLGITQVIVGCLKIAVGITLRFLLLSCDEFLYTPSVFYTAAYWAGVQYIISGSFLIAANSSPKISLVRSGMISNIASGVSSGLSIIIYIVSFHYVAEVSSLWRKDFKVTILTFLLALLMLSSLELLLAIKSVYFSSMALCRRDFGEESIPAVKICASGHLCALQESQQTTELVGDVENIPVSSAIPKEVTTV